MTDTDRSNALEGKLTILTWVVGLMAAVMMSAIPWAFMIQSNVARMTNAIETLTKLVDKLEIPPKWFVEHVRGIDDRVRKLEEKKP